MEIAIIILVVLAIALVFMRILVRARKDSLIHSPVSDKLLILTENNFKDHTGNKLVLVDFWAEWCGPCRMMAPVLSELAEESDGSYFIGKVNVEQHQSLSSKYGVQSIPTLVLFKNGREIKRFVGVKPKEFLRQQIKSAGR